MRGAAGLSAVLAAVLYAIPTTAWAQCDQTLSPGANLGSALAQATPGWTICLNSGNFGAVSLDNVSKSPRVLVKALATHGPVLSLSTSNGASGFTFDGLTLTGWDLSGSSTRTSAS